MSLVIHTLNISCLLLGPNSEILVPYAVKIKVKVKAVFLLN